MYSFWIPDNNPFPLHLFFIKFKTSKSYKSISLLLCILISLYKTNLLILLDLRSVCNFIC